MKLVWKNDLPLAPHIRWQTKLHIFELMSENIAIWIKNKAKDEAANHTDKCKITICPQKMWYLRFNLRCLFLIAIEIFKDNKHNVPHAHVCESISNTSYACSSNPFKENNK